MDKSRVSKITAIVGIPLIGFAVIRFIFQGISLKNFLTGGEWTTDIIIFLMGLVMLLGGAYFYKKFEEE